MAATDNPTREIQDSRKEIVASWTRPVLAALVVLVVGFSIGALAFRDSGPDVPSDVQTLVDEYNQAWLDGDGAGAVSLMTDGARFVSDQYVAEGGISGDALIAHIDTAPVSAIEFNDIDKITGERPYVVVSTGKVGTVDGIGVMHIVEEAGELKIAFTAWLE